jgi:nicotinate phosphoribosyltransferase
MAVGPKKSLLEFGLRRAQGPDGGVSASRFSYLGGFDGTSNVLAGQMFGIPIKGTHAHAFVQSFSSLEGLAPCIVAGHDLLAMATGYRAQLGYKTNDGELAAFVSYAAAFPSGFLALVDT